MLWVVCSHIAAMLASVFKSVYSVCDDPCLPCQSVLCLFVFQIPGGWSRLSSVHLDPVFPVYKALAVTFPCRCLFGYVAALVPLQFFFLLCLHAPHNTHTLSPLSCTLYWFHWPPLSMCFCIFVIHLIILFLFNRVFNKLLCLTFESGVHPTLSWPYESVAAKMLNKPSETKLTKRHSLRT